jgi:ferric-dicitrate binding protein FerR (iron transport regulator)
MIAVLVSVFSATALCAEDASLQMNGIIKSMVGKVEVNSNGAAKWRAAHAGMVVKMGWDLRTYIESSAEIELDNGTVLRVGENSVVTLSKLLLDKRGNVENSDIKVATGKMWANVKKLTNTQSTFEFETPTAVASIRGTRLGISVNQGGTEIDVYEGLVLVRSKGAGKDVAVSSRNRAVITQGTHAIRLVNFAADKDTIRGQAPMHDPFKDSTGTKKIDALLDTTRLASSADTSLRLDVASPASGSSVKETPVLVKGKASRDAVLDIGGKDIVLDRDGSFSSLVDLTLGSNIIVVTVRRGAAWKTANLAVEYHPSLALNIANIVDNMQITSSDMTLDIEVSEGAKFSVNGAEGQTRVSLSPGRNVVTVKAWDQWNTVLEKSFVVNYAKSAGFTLIVTTPKDQSVVQTPTIPVSGSTAPGAKVTVNGTPVSVSPAGFFTYTIPLADEAQDVTVHVVAALGDNDATEDRTVTYTPPRPPLFLTITTPVDGQAVRQNVFRVQGKTSPRAKVTVNGTQANVSSTGVITFDQQFTERDIGDFIFEISAADDTSEITKSFTVKIDPSSPQINTTAPVLSIPLLEGMLVTKVQRLLVNVTDKTPEDQITLEIRNNGAHEEMTFNPGEQQYFNLEEGKNTYSITAYDMAKNPSRQYQGTIYYVPSVFSIDIIEPSDNSLSVEDLPPMPPPGGGAGKSYAGPKMDVQVEIDDGVHTIPEVIRDVRLLYGSNASLMLDRKNYQYYLQVPITRGLTRYTVVVTDIAGNEEGRKTFDMNVR